MLQNDATGATGRTGDAVETSQSTSSRQDHVTLGATSAGPQLSDR